SRQKTRIHGRDCLNCCRLLLAPPLCRSRFPSSSLFRSLWLAGRCAVPGAGRSTRQFQRRHRRARQGTEFRVEGPVREIRPAVPGSEEHTSELQSPYDLVCRLLLEKKKLTDVACE